MITDHTEPVEAWEQLAEDFPKLKYCSEKYSKKAMSNADRANKFPYFETVDYTPPSTKNTYKVYFESYLKENDEMVTRSSFYLPVEQKNGKRIYLYLPETQFTGEKDAFLWTINPHFLSRYRERTKFEGIDNLTELMADIYGKLPNPRVSMENHEGINFNHRSYDGKVDGQRCNRYIPLTNGIAFIRETKTPNKKSGLPQNIYVFEMMTFVDWNHLSASQRKNIKADVKKFLDTEIKQHPELIEEAEKLLKETKPSETKMPSVPTADVNENANTDITPPKETPDSKEAVKENNSDPKRETTPETVSSLEAHTEEILKAKANGITVHRLAVTYKTNTDVIRAMLKNNKQRLEELIHEKEQTTNNKDTMSRKRIDIPQKDIPKVVEMHLAGATAGEISRKFSSTPSVIYSLLKAYAPAKKNDTPEPQDNAEIQNVPELTDDQIKNILLQAYDGTEYSVIASRLSITSRDVTDIVNKYATRIPDIIKEQSTTKIAETKNASGKNETDKYHLSDKEKEDIKILMNEGYSIKEIAEFTNRHFSTIARFFKKENFKEGEAKTHRNLSEKEKTDAINLFKEGISIAAISRTMNCSKTMIQNLIIKHAASLPTTEEKANQASWTEKDILNMYSMRELGTDIAAIASQYGISSEVLNIMMPDIPTNKEEKPLPAKQKTLSDFSEREMIRYLYTKGYRIHEGKLAVEQTVKVNEDDEIFQVLKDAITNAKKNGYNIDISIPTRTVHTLVKIDDIVKDLQ